MFTATLEGEMRFLGLWVWFNVRTFLSCFPLYQIILLTRELSQPATFNFDPIYILLLSRVYRMYRCFQTLLKMGGSG